MSSRPVMLSMAMSGSTTRRDGHNMRVDKEPGRKTCRAFAAIAAATFRMDQAAAAAAAHRACCTTLSSRPWQSLTSTAMLFMPALKSATMLL